MKLSPSLYAADPLRLQQAIEAVEPYSASFHIDIMDGRFAPGFGLSEGLVRRLVDRYVTPVDVHLMVERPVEWAERFAGLGARRVAFHLEATPQPEALLQSVRNAGAAAYLALLPETPIVSAEPFLPEADGLLLLTAPPGGGPFSRKALDRLEEVPITTRVIVDGSLQLEHFKLPILSRVELAVLGKALFEGRNLEERARELAGAIVA
jgi:ribulose-phosphate 3-epimerase